MAQATAPPPDLITGRRGTSCGGTTEPIRNVARVLDGRGRLAKSEPKALRDGAVLAEAVMWAA